jgi:hypothetical protein
MAQAIDKVVQWQFKYNAMPTDKRREILPPRNVNSLYPAQNGTHAMYTGNGRQMIRLLGDPYNENMVFTHEALYEPKWAKTPMPTDLTSVLPDVRKLLLEGKFKEAAEIVERAQFDDGFKPFMNTTNMGAIIPMGSLRLHDAFHLGIRQPESGKTEDYLRWLDFLSGRVTVQWKNDSGGFRRETLVSFEHDVCAIRFTAEKPAALDLDVNIKLPKDDLRGGFRGGLTLPGKCADQLKLTADAVCYELAYFPDYGNKGSCSVIKLIRQGGEATTGEKSISIKGADSLVILTKTVKYESEFTFGCSAAVLAGLSVVPPFDELLASNRRILGGKMERSQIALGDPADSCLSSEELLKRTHTDRTIDPALMTKLYDMGRFYQIVDTGEIPPMWGQHNINTNLQVCAGSNTGLFDEMDVYFRYYETKFDDFRTNARRLFGARGLLASVHCDYDSGLLYHSSKTYPHYFWTGCLGWIYNEFWGYYLVTGDRDFLRDRVIPALKEIALFYEDYACDKGPDGRVLFYPSFSPEDITPFSYTMPDDVYAMSVNAVMDIMICREVLDNLINGCNELGIEQENIERWKAQRALLPAYLADEEGGLKEWAWYGVGENFNHRHVSHHYGLWPGRQVTWETQPELAQAIQISNRKRGHQDDSAHGIIHRLFSAIRLKDVDEAIANLGYMMNHGFVTRALSTSHFPYTGAFPDLQGAMPAVLLEMCVFSAPGEVEFLPAMPTCFPEGAIEGVWLYTFAKLERLEWSCAGLKAVITSRKTQTLTLRCRRQTVSFKVNGAGRPVDGGCVRVDFVPGEAVNIEITFA